jgi:hypothetical protein
MADLLKPDAYAKGQRQVSLAKKGSWKFGFCRVATVNSYLL